MLLLLIGALAAQAPDSLSLDQALARAREYRPEIVAARARLRAARAGQQGAAALPNPLGIYSYTQSPPRRHLTFDQPMDWLLRRGNDLAAATWAFRSAGADSAQTTLDVTREARIAFYRTLAAQDGVEIVRQVAAFMDSLARLAVLRFDAGDISALERDQAALEAQRARLLLSVAEEQREVARAQLAQAVALPLAQLPPAAGALDADLSHPAGPAPLPAVAVPAVQAAQADSAAAEARRRSATRARIPLPSLQGGVEWGDPSQRGQGGLAVIGVSIPLPVFHTNGAAAAAAAAAAEAAGAEVRRRRDDVDRRLAETSARLREAARRALAVRDTIYPVARRQRDRALTAYREGEIGLVPVLEALRADRDVAADLVATLAAFQEALADWHALTGGGA
jgi:outer membrane protein, heavy metal efflux system